MHKRFPGVLFAALVILSGAVAAAHADDYTVDGVHSGASFKIGHLGLSQIPGRFNDVSGTFTIDPDAAKCAFSLAIKAESIDTNNAQRDTHLRSPDFFNTKQFPALSFKSTSVKPVKEGYEVTGDFTMHGVTKPITFMLVGGKKAEFPKGVQRTGFSTDLIVKRSEFGMDKFLEMLSDEVHVAVSFEGTKK
jgi:polyisoprenoid-binding protein YceI